MKRKKGTISMVFGLLLLAAALILTIYNMYDAWRAEQASAVIVPQIEEEIRKAEEERTDNLTPSFNPDREMPTVVVDGYRYIGTIEVPSIDLKLPVMEEWDMTRLRIAVCRYTGSVYKDNMVIAGHNYRKHFRTIRSLPAGTEVIFTDAENNDYVYQIGWNDVLGAADVEEMVTGEWDLTLFTCNYGGNGRYAVRCLRVE